MQFKDLGSLFDGFGELNFKHASKASSFADLDGIDKNTIKGLFKIDSNDISDFTMAQIQAKASTMGLTESLTDELMAMSKDADFTAKAKVGKVTWGEALKEGSTNADQIGKALMKSSDVSDKAKKKLSEVYDKFGSGSQVYQKQLENIINGANGLDDISGKFTTLGADVQKSTGMFESAGNIIKGFFASIKGYIPILAVAGTAFAAFKLWDYSQTGYTRASEKLDKSSGEYETTKSELNSLNSQLDETKSRIEELQSMKKDGTITVADEAELSKLQQQNSELERQVALKESLAKKQAEVVAKDEKKVSETGQTYTEAMREKYGAVKGTLMGIIGNYKDPTLKDANGNMSKSAAEAWSEENGGKDGKATIEQQMKANIKKLKDYKKDLKKAQKEKNQADVDAAQENIDEISKTLSSESSTIQGWIDASKDANGNIIKSMRGSVREWNSILTDYQNIDLTKAQKNYNNLENYFNSSAGSSMKSYLEDIVKNGGSAQDALDAFRESGMRLNDIGVNSSTFLKYFEEVKKSAEEAADAVDQVDGSFDGMKTASESANQGVNYDSTMGYYKTAKEAYSEGLWGTDDFQTVAQFAVGYDISKKLKENADAYTYASDAYKEAWENGGSQLMERWYGNENELVNMTHVLEDFQNAGLASSNGNGEWLFKNSDGSMKFKTTAEAAEKLHTSVDNVEVAMSKLEEHGFEFDGIEKSGKLLNDYKDNLDGLKTIYDSLNEGDDKDRIGKLIEGYDSEYEKFQDDMSGLSEDQVVKIKFEYDLATLKQQIQDLKETAYATGDNQDWAAVTVSQKQAIDKLEKQTGVNADNDKGYSGSKDKIKELRSGMKGATEDERAAINEQISAIQTLEQNYLDFKNQGGKLNWEDYLNTAEATKAFEEISENGSLTVDDLKSLFGDGVTIEYTAEIKNEAQLEEKLNSLKNGESITFEAKVDDAETAVRAIKNEDGTITYKADIGGVEQDVDKIVDKDGNIRYTAEFDGSNIDWLKENLDKEETIYFDANVDGATEKIAAIKDENGEIKYIGVDNGVQVYLSQVQNADGSISYTIGSAPTKVPDANGVSNYGLGNYPKSTPDVNGTANYRGNFPTSAPTITGVIRYTIQKVGSAITSAGEGINKGGKGWRIAGGGFNGTAHVLGSAYSSGNWGINKSETALVGELGTETIVRNGKFFTVGDNGAEFAHIQKGDIIFNHKQTEELFKNGYVTSGGGRAKIYGESFAYGTAYASGGRLPSSISSKKKNTSSKKSSTKSSSTKSSGTSGKSSSNNGSSNSDSSSSSDSSKETKETLDWIETKLDRIKRDIDLIDKTASNTYKTWSERNKALVSELSQVSNELSVQQQAYDRYIQQANSVGLSEDWASKVRDGLISIEDITDEDLKTKISDYKTWYEKALDCRDAIADLKEQESKLYEQKFKNLQDEYDNILEEFDHTKNMLEGYIDLAETAGYISSSKYYDSLIENENEKLNKLYEKRDALAVSLDEAINSGKIAKYSEAWYSMQKEINSVDEAIVDCNKNTLEWSNNIRQIEWDIFDKIQDKISGITDEANFLEKLMSSEDMYDDKNGGQITEYGKATLGLHGVKYNTAMSQADEYRKEMEKIDEALKSDSWNQDLVDRRKKLLELQRESILAAKDEKNAIKDLIEDGIKAQLDALKDLIDKYTDLMDTNKDLYDYEKNIEEKQKTISSLEKQKLSYAGDTSEEGASKRQQIENDLADARQDLEETMYNRSIADQKKLLDDLYDQYEEILNLRLDNIDMLVQDVITNINDGSSGIRETLETVSSNVGYQLSDSMNTIWNSANQVITTYGDKFTSSITGVQNAINALKDVVQKAVDASNKNATNTISNGVNKPASSNTSNKPASTPTTTPATTQGNGKPEIGDAVTYASGDYYYSSDGKSPTGHQMRGQTVYITKINNAAWAKKKYHIARDKAGAHPLGWVDLSQISGYQDGTKRIPYDQLAELLEDGKDETIVTRDGHILRRMTQGEMVLDNKSTENLWKLAQQPAEYLQEVLLNGMNYQDMVQLPKVDAPGNNITEYAPVNNFVINIDKPNNYPEFYKEMMTRFQNDIKAEKLVQHMTLGKINGQGNLNKYSVKF